MKKFLIALIFCLCIGSVVLVGCGGNKEQNPPLDPSISNPSTPSNPSTTLETPQTPATPETPDEKDNQESQTPQTPEENTPSNPDVNPEDSQNPNDDEHEDENNFPIELQQKLEQFFKDNSYMLASLYDSGDPFDQIEVSYGDVLTMKINGTEDFANQAFGYEMLEADFQTILDMAADDPELESYQFEMNFDSSHVEYCIVTFSLTNP